MHIRCVFKKTTAGGTTFETFESAPLVRKDRRQRRTDETDGRTDESGRRRRGVYRS